MAASSPCNLYLPSYAARPADLFQLYTASLAAALNRGLRAPGADEGAKARCGAFPAWLACLEPLCEGGCIVCSQGEIAA